MTAWKWSFSENLWHENRKARSSLHENSFWSIHVGGPINILASIWTTTNLESVSSEGKSMNQHEFSGWWRTNCEAVACSVEICSSHVGSFATVIMSWNRIKSHDVCDPMTTNVLFRHKRKRSTYNRSKICLDYLSHAIYIQIESKECSVKGNRWKEMKIQEKIHWRLIEKDCRIQQKTREFMIETKLIKSCEP